MPYNSIKAAIPKCWLTKLKSLPVMKFEKQEKLTLKIGKSYKHISKLTCKDFYWKLICTTNTCPAVINKWEELYNYVNLKWEHIFGQLYLTTCETSLQNLQYQITRE